LKTKKDSDTYGATLYLFKSELATPQYTFQSKPNSFLADQALFPKKTRDPGPGSYDLERASDSHRPKIHGGVKWHKPEIKSAKYTTPGPADYRVPEEKP
jgi:hypothetical protein